MWNCEAPRPTRMEPFVKQQCSAVLETLMTQPDGWIFSSPVDPVRWNVPDYFSIISNPMDLGTIKSKLASCRYFTAQEFASDIKLTFSNAMRYNPPHNPVHHMAKNLECVFIRRWKLLEARWKREAARTQQGMVASGSAMKPLGVISIGSEKAATDTKKEAFLISTGIKKIGIKKIGSEKAATDTKKETFLISTGIKKIGSEKAATDTKKEAFLISTGIKKIGSEKAATDTKKETFCKKPQGLISTGIQKIGIKKLGSETAATDTKKAFCKEQQGLISTGIKKNTQCKKSESGSVLFKKESMSLGERRKLRKDLTDMLKGKLNGKLRTVLQKCGFFDIKSEKFALDIDALHDDILWELKRVLKDSSDATSGKKCANVILSTQLKFQDTESKILSAPASRLELHSSCQSTESCGSSLDEEKMCPSSSLSTTVTTAVSREDLTSLIGDEQALQRALRAAMLKSRFAEIISKVNGGGDKADDQQERAILKRLQDEEKAFKAWIREEQLKKEAELKKQREKERQAARLALERMERTVYLEDNLMSLKELERLSQCSPSYVLHGNSAVMVLRASGTGQILKPLEQLGLHLKEEFMPDDDEETLLSGEAEEGEILG